MVDKINKRAMLGPSIYQHHHCPGVKSAHGRLYAAGHVDSRPGEGAGDGHRAEEGAQDVADAEGEHVHAGVHRLASG